MQSMPMGMPRVRDAKKSTPAERATVTPRAPISYQSVKSLPPDYRYAGVPSGILESEGRGSSARLGDLDEEDRWVDDDSPYNSIANSMEGGNLEDEEDVSLNSANVRVSSSNSWGSTSKWEDTDTYDAKKKLQAWYQLPSGDWELGKIVSTSGTDSMVACPDGKVLRISTESLLPANPEILEGVDDLLQLSFLNEPSVLHNLKFRHQNDKIYTRAGPVLVAINPFKEVPLYGSKFIEAYKKKSINSPHVYAIADTAIREMIRDEVNQSIIVSGESGAGKTETAKIAMQYLAALGGGSGIEYEILQTNPILEAFGNARTSRNDNSSRFGKLIEIHFSVTGKISGASIQTFLLEKSRVVQSAIGERSYHIFYQLCAGASESLRKKLNLRSVDEYNYLSQSNCYTIPGVDDVERFHAVVEAMNVVHISKEDQESVFAMLAAVLWLGNVSFTVIDNDNRVEIVADEAAETVAELIGCTISDLNTALSTRKMKVRNETIVQKLKHPQAIDTRDALAKSIYASLFDWIVDQINKSLGVVRRHTGRSIGILDIYGFESFEKNSFEQFCINYANERLQQHFNRHLFKLEQDEYIQDGLDWARVDFDDNQDCLKLFEKKPLGLLSLLDEESTFPNGTDLSLANKLKQHLSSNRCFRGEKDKAFSVNHYAGEVTYDTTGFLEKNRDLLQMESIQLLSSCSNKLPQIFASKMLHQSENGTANSSRSNGIDTKKLSVATKFKGQLFQLMQRLGSTTPHFIRCIKPNNLQLPESYEQGLVLQQLRCCGVLEVVRISRSGYPTRMSHQKFAKRYGFLLENVESQDPLSVSVAILNQFNIRPEMYRVGFTKLFFRTGQISALEDTRNRTLHNILRIQSCFRGYLARRSVRDRAKRIITLQSVIRGHNTRRMYSELLRKHRAAVILQRNIKSHTARREFMNTRTATVTIQSIIRGWLVRSGTGDTALLKNLGRTRGGQPEYIVIKASVLADLQRRILKAEATIRDKDDEVDILRQKLQDYEIRWSEYEQKMRSMEEVWQKQMKSLQSSLSLAKRSLAADDDSPRPSDASVDHSWESDNYMVTKKWDEKASAPRSPAYNRDMSAGLNFISTLAEEFEQRTRVFVDDANFLAEVKSGEAQASPNMNAEKELKLLKQNFEVWRKDFSVRLRDTKVILNKVGADKGKKKWWGRLNSTRHM